MLKTLPSESAALAETAILTMPPATPGQAIPADEGTDVSSDSLFEHFAWLYIFCREKLFRDDTTRMSESLWPGGKPVPGQNLIELGCGPGFYSCGLAQKFPEITVLGIDRSPKQLAWAREKRNRLGLGNCRFKSDNVLDLSLAEQSVDLLIE